MDTNKDTKQAATSAVAGTTSTPGAIHADVSPMKKGQQAVEKTTLNGGPSYYPEDHHQPPQQLLSILVQESLSPTKKAVGQSSKKKADEEKLKQVLGKAKKKKKKKKKKTSTSTDPYSTDAVATAGETDFRTTRIASRTTDGDLEESISSERVAGKSHVEKKSDEKVKASQRQENRRQTLGEDTKPPAGVSPIQEGEQGDQYEDEEDATSGAAIRIQGMNSAGRGEEEAGFTIMPVEDSTIVEAIDIQHEMNAAKSTRTIVEAQLVKENEREKLEVELRQKFLDEQMGQVAQAEVVEDHGNETRLRAMLCTGIVLILLTIIVASVLGTRDTSPTTAPAITNVTTFGNNITNVTTFGNNSLCGEAHSILLGNAAIVASLENATEQVVVFCEVPGQSIGVHFGLWYKYIGQGKPVITQASGGVDLHVYPACDQTAPTCDITDAIYGSSSSSSAVAWTAVSGVEYLLLVTSAAFSSGSTISLKFDIRIFNDTVITAPPRPMVQDTPTAAPTPLALKDQIDLTLRAIDLNDIVYIVGTDDLPDLDSAAYVGLQDDPTEKPARRAMSWLLFSDGRNVRDETVNRWALASIYYSMGGEKWPKQQDWLSDESICEWHGLDCDAFSVLREIDLSENNLVGQVPLEFAMLETAQAISLRDNQISGELNGEIFGYLPRLTILYLENNKFSGTIPESLRDNGVLQTLFLQQNGFSGDFPQAFCPATYFASPPLRNFGVDCPEVVCGCCSVWNCF